jgi:predicted acylesterase/phospholipase RssA
VVFAGGGTRCFWQLGFWSVCGPALGLAPRVVAAVSAGSAIACAALLGRCEETLALFRRAVAANPKNAYPENLLAGRPRVFPHAAIYRRAILELVDAEGLARLQERVDLRVVVGRPPAGLGAGPGLLLGLGCYLLSRRLGDPVHPELARRIGFRAESVNVRSCRSVDELADLILASSATPPFTEVVPYRGRPAIDGSVVDNAPLFALEGHARRTLVLLTRSYRSLPPARGELLYLGPSRPIPIRKWDYTSPELLDRTYELGQRDGEAFLRRDGVFSGA